MEFIEIVDIYKIKADHVHERFIAAKLGVRSCDIAGLNIDDIHRTEGVMRLTQQKTNIPIEFPILPDISIALDDYLNNARPNSCLLHSHFPDA
jgi:hypothetical protein